jgi:hypothetical protein
MLYQAILQERLGPKTNGSQPPRQEHRNSGHIIYLIAYLGELFTHSINGLLV